jgi:hypothetical protein
MLTEPIEVNNSLAKSTNGIIMVEDQPSVYIYGIRLDEPVTTATDLLISFVCFYAFYQLRRISEKKPLHRYLRFYFMSMGIATAIGGLIGHGFLHYFSFAWKLPGWLTSMLSIALIERASIEQARNVISHRFAHSLSVLNIIELLTFMTLTFTTLNFFFVEVHTAYGLFIVVGSLNFYNFLKTRDPGSRQFLIAVGISAIGALVFMNQWSIHMG